MSATKNHDDQPNVCDICGKRVFVKESAMYFYDDTLVKKHRTAHTACIVIATRAA